MFKNLRVYVMTVAKRALNKFIVSKTGTNNLMYHLSFH